MSRLTVSTASIGDERAAAEAALRDSPCPGCNGGKTHPARVGGGVCLDCGGSGIDAPDFVSDAEHAQLEVAERRRRFFSARARR